MMKTALLFALAVSVLPVAAQAPLTDAQQADCAAGGGCLTLTRAQVVKALGDAHELGREKGRAQGYEKGQSTCWKPA